MNAPTRPLLSVIVPVYNEAATFHDAFEPLLAKTVPDVDIEILVVESNSTDGSRDLVLQYKDHPRVRILLEDSPRGKGHAVRAALRDVRGDIILIQDADLEYDVNDYDVLLEPLLARRISFVLGSRHGGTTWKMRIFTEQRILGNILNLAHLFFTFLLNQTLRTQLKDPFTMYKVFRRECLDGIVLECNRFDFDWELLIKLVRNGHRPIEIPVSYRSRSFKEGKKIRMFRDPLTWMAALAKYGFLRR